jgi:hypothetical protein
MLIAFIITISADTESYDIFFYVFLSTVTRDTFLVNII